MLITKAKSVPISSKIVKAQSSNHATKLLFINIVIEKYFCDILGYREHQAIVTGFFVFYFAYIIIIKH